MRTPSKSKKSVVSPRIPHSAFRIPHSHGFTLLELLIVIALIMVLMGLLIPAFYKVKGKAQEKRAQIEAMVIGSAIRDYKLQEKKFPAPTGDLAGGSDRRYGDGQGSAYGDAADNANNVGVMNIIKMTVPPVLDENKLRWDPDGNVINPWGRQYRIRLDLDYDGKLIVPEDESKCVCDYNNRTPPEMQKLTSKYLEYHVEWNICPDCPLPLTH